MDTKQGWLELGKYTIEWIDGHLYISSDGEGGEFSEDALETAIDQFYNEHF